MSGLTVAILQPAYLPWLGYFDLMDQCDLFVLLDSVQYERHYWQQRNRIKTPEGALWLTVPVHSKGKRDQRIRDVQLDERSGFQKRHLRSIQSAYGGAPYFEQYIGGLRAILDTRHEFLAALTIELIEWLRGILGIKAELIRSSSLDVESQKAELLVSICKAVGATRYISPARARVYLEGTPLFEQHGIELCYQTYTHPSYRQLFGGFIPFLSVVDLLMNEGAGSLSIFRSGRGLPTPQSALAHLSSGP